MADQVFAVNSGFYDAVDSDRTYSADDMNRPYKRVVSNGVFATPKGTKSTDLQVVSANNGMQIIVKKGEGIFADKWFENPAAINITVPANTSTVPRIDSVIVQVDKRTSGRVGNIVYRTGTPSVNPTAPSINTVANVTEYRLANVRVETGTTAITTAMITDRRGSSDCPWVTSLIYQVDTSVLYDQWAAAYEEYFEAEKEMWDDWYSHLTEELDVSMTLIKHTSTFVTTQETSEITIGISDFNAETDMLEVYINGMRAIDGSQYTINGNTSIILSAPLGVGQTVNFVCLKSVIMGNPDDITHVIEALEERIASITGGVPTVVDSASAMTDTDKIYILTTDSKWYYYNLTSSAWVAGGVYGGVPTDRTLTQAGMSADAKAVGDKINEVEANLSDIPNTLASDADGVDLDITDTQGNVILRLANKNIQTEDFNSALDTRHWVGKKWTAIGDSLTEVNQRTTKHYHDYISEATGINVVNLGHSGAGYYARPSDYCFRRRALQVETDSDVVTIFGSGNDVDKISLGNVTDTTADTLCGCINITIDNIFATAPLVPLGIITPTPWYQQSGAKNWTPSNPGNPMELYVNAIVEICERRSIPCLDLYHCSNLHPDIASFRSIQFSKDDGNGIHPDETGHFLISARFQAFLDTLLLH